LAGSSFKAVLTKSLPAGVVVVVVVVFAGAVLDTTGEVDEAGIVDMVVGIDEVVTLPPPQPATVRAIVKREIIMNSKELVFIAVNSLFLLYSSL
jgi:hypothetical protein